MTTRTVHQLIKSVPASDGAGVKLRRSLGQSHFARLDPFLRQKEDKPVVIDPQIFLHSIRASRGVYSSFKIRTVFDVILCRSSSRMPQIQTISPFETRIGIAVF